MESYCGTADISFEKLIADGKVNKIELFVPSHLKPGYNHEISVKSQKQLSNYDIAGMVAEIFARSILALTIVPLFFGSYTSKFKILYNDIVSGQVADTTKYVVRREISNPSRNTYS